MSLVNPQNSYLQAVSEQRDSFKIELQSLREENLTIKNLNDNLKVETLRLKSLTDELFAKIARLKKNEGRGLNPSTREATCQTDAVCFPERQSTSVQTSVPIIGNNEEAVETLESREISAGENEHASEGNGINSVNLPLRNTNNDLQTLPPRSALLVSKTAELKSKKTPTPIHETIKLDMVEQDKPIDSELDPNALLVSQRTSPREEGLYNLAKPEMLEPESSVVPLSLPIPKRRLVPYVLIAHTSNQLRPSLSKRSKPQHSGSDSSSTEKRVPKRAKTIDTTSEEKKHDTERAGVSLGGCSADTPQWAATESESENEVDQLDESSGDSCPAQEDGEECSTTELPQAVAYVKTDRRKPLKFKGKKAEAIILPKETIEFHLHGLVNLSIRPHPIPTIVSRLFLSKVYGAGTQGFVTEMSRSHAVSARHAMFPQRVVNPYMPSSPGEPGLIFSPRHDILEGVWSLFSREKSKSLLVWRYLGEYASTLAGSLTPAEFKAQNPEVQKSWAHRILSAKKWPYYTRMVARVYLRIQREDVTERGIETVLERFNDNTDGFGYAMGLQPHNIWKSFETGEEAINVVTMQCYSYDHDFAAHCRENYLLFLKSSAQKRIQNKHKRAGGSTIQNLPDSDSDFSQTTGHADRTKSSNEICRRSTRKRRKSFKLQSGEAFEDEESD